MILILFPEHFELSLVLLGMLLAAFTFAGAMDRLQGRKALVFQEAQALSTAYGRVRLLPEVFQGPMREAIRQFTDGLLGVYGSGRSLEGFETGWVGVERGGDQVLKVAVDARRTPEGCPFADEVLPPINDLLDTAGARRTALRSHPPTII